MGEPDAGTDAADRADDRGEPSFGKRTDFEEEPTDGSPLDHIPQTHADGPFERLDQHSGTRITGQYKEGKASATWTGWFPSGERQFQGTMSGGRLEGRWTSWYRNGRLREQGEYENGHVHGAWKMFYENGTPFEELHFKDGKQHGRWQMFHRSGKLAEDMTWSMGLQEGLQTDYDPAGRKVAEGSFAAHRPVGKWSCWNPEEPGAAPRTIAAPGERLTPAEACGFSFEQGAPGEDQPRAGGRP